MVNRVRSIGLMVALLGAPALLQAQVTSPDARRPEATRQDLQGLLNQAGGKLSADERQVIQGRLTNGDFTPGDKVALKVLDEPTLTDTFTVKTGRVISLPNIGDVSLQGVLRSELEQYLTQKVAQYIRNPQVHANGLIRIAVMGAVSRPGFYVVPASTVASDVLMLAGGPASNADLAKTVVRRDALPIVDRDQVRQAFADGVTLDQLNLHSGDEFLVGQKGGGFTGALQTAGLLSGIAFGIVALSKL
jgi:protein involved in polysaccharide export with SLBB domain